MRRILALLLAIFTISSAAAADPNEIPLAKAVECTPRAGLSNVLKKLATPEAEVKVAYLGGSITAQPGWRVKSLAYLQKAYPQAKLREVNAAIGGTGSDLGVFRLQHDVLQHKPDLLFVEFAVNDGGQAPQKIFQCMEGIVRQTWRTLPECDICFVYTITEALAKPLSEGKYPRAASAMEQVADHYGIPSIHFALEVVKLADEGKLLWKSPLPKTDEEKQALGDKVPFANDGVHPYPETGHELYLQAIERSFPKLVAASKEPTKHELPAPFAVGNFEDAKLIPLSRAKLSSGLTPLEPTHRLAKSFGNRLGTIYHTNKPGETISFRFQGRYAAVYDLLGPDCGQITVSLDDNKPALVPRFDSYSTYHRLATMVIGSELAADQTHAVKLELHPEQPDKPTILARRNEKIDNPQRFDDTAWYAGGILLLGELVE